ncbi:MAG: deoxyribose-phosphate aldolase, partial [Bacteroidales bacterium]|nr:deoxyribose-phosphate aldolase [Bacteroidales bacterium]
AICPGLGNFALNRETKNTLIGDIDLTTLAGDDTNGKIIQLCDKANRLSDKRIKTIPAVCFYPAFIRLAKSELKDSGIKVASVAGAFPHGQTSISIKVNEVKYALDEGADEIDMVISRGKFLDGEYSCVHDEIAAIKEACGMVHLKVILETGELKTIQSIRKASEISLLAGADFLKTSTGKIKPAATEDAFVVMADTVKEYFDKTGKKTGLKAAGGISDPNQAYIFSQLVSNVLGEEFLTADLFRIGASRLLDNLLG